MLCERQSTKSLERIKKRESSDSSSDFALFPMGKSAARRGKSSGVHLRVRHRRRSGPHHRRGCRRRRNRLRGNPSCGQNCCRDYRRRNRQNYRFWGKNFSKRRRSGRHHRHGCHRHRNRLSELVQDQEHRARAYRGLGEVVAENAALGEVGDGKRWGASGEVVERDRAKSQTSASGVRM